ncbi:hypothetical protein ABFS82_14G197100 [Erythranthe guttata]|uniref:RING-type E3 ubiquitin transferase n=1 Tax=Erythranthe guttata TaxID=4155 RepID=A0A022RDK9_ERYGU|nr:PREDICTED: uncharacterized protein LOC105957260 [Erythranthe guttata]EYU38134.1 hypothetical protein MIMGU_mgv1a010644mg [Erythranthe guttata]|eukprot:XP_012836647.1 PREDICTED: uncharacterized protein LOC105957260 [Erythranthe guttata]
MDWSKLKMDLSKLEIDLSKLEIDWSWLIPVEGTVCCVVSAVLYAGGALVQGEAKELDSVVRVSKLKDLSQLLDAASTVFPLVVAVTGLVSSDTPIECEYSGLKGVIVDNKEETHILRRNFRGVWKKESILPASVWNEVPWYLDDGTGRASVLDARSANTLTYAGLPMTCGGEVFERSIQSSIHEKIELDNGVKTLGVQKTERVLPTGTCLTVIGEVIKDETGAFAIQKPYRLPFYYISYRSVSEIIENLRSHSSVCMYASAAFGVMGGILIVRHAFRYMEYKKMQKREAELRRRLLAAAKQASNKQ